MLPKPIRRVQVGSGTVIALGVLITTVLLLYSGHVVGWDPTWRSIGVTPLQPHFYDMHVITDYAACAAKGFDPYIPHSCNPANFNIPRAWLSIGLLGIDGSDSVWLSVVMIAAAFAVVLALLKGRSMADGGLAMLAILSPSVMMGVERGNLDLLILALVGVAALIYEEQRTGGVLAAIALISLAVALKLFPIFSVALGARLRRQAVIFSVIVSVLSLAYLAGTFNDVTLIRRNVPTTFILSYGYKAPFFGVDHLRMEAGVASILLENSWTPIMAAICTMALAVAAAVVGLYYRKSCCAVTNSVAGTAFFFGGGIYCGTFMLGTNFIYRLMFLLLCVPQLLDWQKTKSDNKTTAIESALLVTLLSVLWLNGNANGHSTFLWVPQLLDWLLFFGLAAVLVLNLLNGVMQLSASSRVKL